MKPTRIEHDTHEAHAKRQQEHAAATKLARRITHGRETRFRSATEMLAWFFEHASHMASIPAIDPSAEVIQGLRVDRDERHWWIQSVRQALAHLERTSENSVGSVLLWLHLRPRQKTGQKRKRGVIVPIYRDPVPIWELWQAPELKALSKSDKRYHLSEKRAVKAYREAIAVVEKYAVEKGWLEARPHRPRTEQTYRREHQ